MHILVYSDIITHKQTYSQAYSEPFKFSTLKNVIFFNTGLICIAKVFIRQKVWSPRKPGVGGREFIIHLFVDVMK